MRETVLDPEESGDREKLLDTNEICPTAKENVLFRY